MPNETHTCCVVTSYTPIWGSMVCKRAASVERDGKWFCKMHDPAKAEAREAARNAKLARERELSAVRRQAQELENTLVREAASGTVSVGRLQELALGVQAARAKAGELIALLRES